ncbi:zinc finger protein 479 [Culex quinquefasciatus]|uniref:Zinc finger protein 479 n=1 Tax=Culex quinquefasciatus TaxID=7176 RepID=B0X6K0_CULQU|nr:zinc finger protein 479 [Culex quinquefasciatus]|eukprot:XP_001865272.1 zinc finger protein 479 [Culex quinquefasciatus]
MCSWFIVYGKQYTIQMIHEIDDKSNIEILDIVTEESIVMQDENSRDTNSEPVKLETNTSPNQLILETEHHIEPAKKNVKKHLKRLHFRTGKRIPCKECQDQGSPVEFSSNFKLRDHILRVHRGIVGPPERKFICSYCGKKFSRSSHLKSHENDVHTKAIVFKCNYCTKFTATSRCSLLRHERTHTAEKPFKCDECGAAFNQSNAVKLHKTLKHSDERPYQCTFCDATFKGKYVLKRHLELHEQKNDVRKRSPRGVRQKRIRKKATEADPSSEN